MSKDVEYIAKLRSDLDRAVRIIRSVLYSADTSDRPPLVVLSPKTSLLEEPSCGVDWERAPTHPTHEDIESWVRHAFYVGLNYCGDEE